MERIHKRVGQLSLPTRRRVVLVMIVLLTLGLYGAHAQQSAAGGRADVVLALRVVPDVGVTPGSIVTYELRATNLNGSEADRVLVQMPYDPAQLRVLDAQFQSDQDWVTAVQGNYLTLQFGTLNGNSSRTATIRMQVNETLPLGTVINMWAGYGWDDGGGGGADRSANAAPVVVEPVAISSGTLWMAVDPPVGVAGTAYGFFTNRFIPGERLRVALHSPYGVQPLPLDTNADNMGQAWFEFNSTGYPPGNYTLVVDGTLSGQTAAADFSIE